MNTLKLTCFGFLALSFIALSACDLVQSLDEYEPTNRLEAGKAVTDGSSAELALTGAYEMLLNSGSPPGFPYISIIPSFMGATANAGASYSTDTEIRGFNDNQPIATGSNTTLMYTSMYTLINRANYVMQETGNLNENQFSNPARKQQIIAEAKGLRALGHFYLLRLWGQFYDDGSEYGIVTRTQPSDSPEAQPRSTVADTYDLIIQDLDDVIANAPVLRDKYYINQTFGKAMKAKVLLYRGDYGEAATLAEEVIDNSSSSFSLISSFQDVFDRSSAQTFNNNSAIFDVYTDDDEGLSAGFFWGGVLASVSDSYVNLAQTGSMTVNGQEISYDDTRIAFMLSGSTTFGPYSNNKFSQTGGAVYETLYHLRMAEMYLIFAEAEARSNNSVTSDALEALNDVRERAGATTTGGDGFETYPSSISYDQFLEAVRIEKVMELACENGETWFDLVRFDYADGFGSGFQVSDVKSTATNPDKFILPIPAQTIEAGENVVDQNPSY